MKDCSKEACELNRLGGIMLAWMSFDSNEQTNNQTTTAIMSTQSKYTNNNALHSEFCTQHWRKRTASGWKQMNLFSLLTQKSISLSFEHGQAHRSNLKRFNNFITS